MSLVRDIEQKIRRIEGFAVRFLHEDGRDLRGDRANIRQYPFERAAGDDATVEWWKGHRFRPYYPLLRVEVKFRNGEAAPGNTKLATVRCSYR